MSNVAHESIVVVFQAALGCNSEITKNLVQKYEPYITDPLAFPKIQVRLLLTCILFTL